MYLSPLVPLTLACVLLAQLVRTMILKRARLWALSQMSQTAGLGLMTPLAPFSFIQPHG
jgi:hypothetical protein